MFLDQRHRVLNNIERGEPEKIHLEKRQLLQAHHVVLGDNFVFAGFAERHKLPERHRRDHHARRVHAGVARHPLHFARHFQHFLEPRILAGRFLNGRLLLHGFLQLDVEREWE